MHVTGFAHCDIKPANCLLDLDTPTNRLVAIIADFGITEVIDETKLKVKAFKVSPVRGASLPYTSPEVLLEFMTGVFKKTHLAARDTYAIASMMCEMLTRRSLWSR